jgi:hypothetical protein
MIGKPRGKIGELEGESQRQEGMIGREASEIEGSKTAKQKIEDELERSTGRKLE